VLKWSNVIYFETGGVFDKVKTGNKVGKDILTDDSLVCDIVYMTRTNI
jgi:hypothetical protein